MKAIVTTLAVSASQRDAMGIQKEIAKIIAERGADYILALKGNQGSVFEDVQWLFEQAQAVQCQDVVQDVAQTIDEGHGRIEIAGVRHRQKQNSIIWCRSHSGTDSRAS